MNAKFLLLLPLLFVACQSGPTTADVAADRARWQAMRDVTLDRTVDDVEAPILGQLFAAWDAKLSADEQRLVAADTTWQDLLRVYGPLTLEAFGIDLEARAPELFRFIDRNGNHLLDLEELQSLSVDTLKNPVFAAALVSTAVRLAAGKK